ncbi:MAG TPA: hypothetical protein VLG50_08365 [Candidatus Saccharimonadales bacterium]|nr:hypothetical protein [Candidatus Saccharimonadales bacterium]
MSNDSIEFIINATREETICNNYNAAVAQIKNLVEKNPFQTSFKVDAGCISSEMTNEIARRFNQGGIKAAVSENGIVTSGWNIHITCPLPSVNY